MDPPARDQWVLIRRARQLITLHGPSGPRRGAAMNDIGLVSDGAILIRNGVIVESGPSRRIENLQQARNAREIDAQGKVVIPGFVDADSVLVMPLPPRTGASKPEVSLRVLSRQVLEAGAASAVASLARCGVLTVGAHTGFALDLRDTTKTLLIHQGLQNKPLRIRSIFSPRVGTDTKDLIDKWLPATRKRKLSSILELTVPHSQGLREIATAGASAGYSLRIRSAVPLDERDCLVAFEGGAVAIVAPPPENSEWSRKLASVGCVHVVSAADVLRHNAMLGVQTRALIDDGAAVALASSYTPRAISSFNPQFLLHLAVTNFGMTAEEALCATIWNAACSLRLSHVTGSLEPGKAADILVMDVHDYRELSRRAGHNDVQLAIRAGQSVYRRAGLNLD
jgi:imidazolonepropionase